MLPNRNEVDPIRRMLGGPVVSEHREWFSGNPPKAETLSGGRYSLAVQVHRALAQAPRSYAFVYWERRDGFGYRIPLPQKGECVTIAVGRRQDLKKVENKKLVEMAATVKERGKKRGLVAEIRKRGGKIFRQVLRVAKSGAGRSLLNEVRRFPGFKYSPIAVPTARWYSSQGERLKALALYLASIEKKGVVSAIDSIVNDPESTDREKTAMYVNLVFAHKDVPKEKRSRWIDVLESGYKDFHRKKLNDISGAMTANRIDKLVKKAKNRLFDDLDRARRVATEHHRWCKRTFTVD